MTLEELRQFCTVARMGNITKAANALFISQPSLSRHISSLETSLGVQLMYRDNRRISLTRAGEEFRLGAEEILGRIDQLEERVRTIGNDGEGHIVIASINFRHPWLFDFYNSFRFEHPELYFDIRHYPLGAGVSRALRNHEADIGVCCSFDLPLERDRIESVSVGRDELAVLLPAGHSLSDESGIRLEMLEGESFLSLSGCTQEMLNYFSFPKMPFAGTASDIETLVLKVRSGLGFTILPSMICELHANGCAVKRIAGFDSGYDIAAFWPKNVSNPTIPVFIDALKEYSGNK